MTISTIIAQILGFMGLGSNIASVQSKRRHLVLVFQILANVLYGVQYIFLNAWAGLAVSLISALECILVYIWAYRQRSNQSKAVSADASSETSTNKLPLPIMLALVIAVTIAGFFSYADIFSLIPIVVTIGYFWSVWQPKLRLFRLMAVFISIGWFVYNLHVNAYVAMATAVVEAISAILAIIRIDILKR